MSVGFVMCENVLVTTWNWVYLADFASFKPAYIPHDDPSDFSFFFDTGGRRLCYLAPERFYEHGRDTPVAPDVLLKPSMDIFAMGCVIAEVFLEGHPLFELSQLLAYRRGQYDPSPHLEKIPDPGIRMMILHMIQLNPDERLSAEGYLLNYAGVAFPNYFSPFLHDFYSCLSSLDPDARVEMCQSSFHEIVKQMTHGESCDETTEGFEVPANTVASMTSQQMVVQEVHNHTNESLRNENLRNGSAHEQVKLLDDLSSLLRQVDQSNHFSNDMSREDASKSHTVQNQEYKWNYSSNRLFQRISGVFKRSEHAFLKKITIDELKSLMSQYNSEADTYQMPFENLPREAMSCEGMVLITSLLCSSLRNIKFPQLRRSCILLLKSLSVYIDDEDCLQHVLPYVIFMLSDPAAIVRSAAIETICDILPLVREFPPSDAKIFPEYILPMLSMFPDDLEESVRICYASNISKLALTSYAFFIQSISMSKAGVLDELSAPQKSSVPSINNVNIQLSHLRKSVAEVVRALVMGLKQTPKIRRALLQDIAGLCCFFGQKQSNDFLLPILPAFLNDNDEQLRTVFFEQIVYVCLFVGQRSVEEYLLPYIEQALSDTSEGVIANTLGCLTILCDNGFLRKGILVEIIQHAFPLLCYPSQWVRNSVASFIAASSESLGVVDSYVFVAPVVHPFLRRQLASLTSQKALLSCLKPPVSRQVFYQVLENARGLDMAERQSKIWHASKQGENVSSPTKGQESGDQKIGKLSVNSEVPLRAVGGSTTLDNHLKFSGLTSPQLSGIPNVLLNKSSENIPLYSFSVDKREVGNSQEANDASQRLRSLRMGSSSSFAIAKGSKQFHRVVQEPEAKESDQRNSVSIEDVSWISTLPELGWKPRGVLVAHLQEHRSSVNDIAVSTDGKFFLSVSDDSTVKLWESRKLEKNMSFRSRMTYSLEGSRALCAIMLRGSPQVVVGSCDGKLRAFCVDYTSRGLENGNVIEKCSGLSNVNKTETGEGAILSVVNSPEAYSNRTIMYSTQSCGIHLWDARASTNSWTLKANPEEGYVSKLVTDPCGNWFVSGSSRGVLSLWDLRFLIPVKSWAYPRPCQIEDMCLYIPPPNTPLSANAKPLIYVAAGFNEVSLWNAGTGSCHQVFQVPDSDTSDLPWALSRPPIKGNPMLDQKYRVDEFNEPTPHLPGFRSLLPLPGGDLLTAGTDLKIRRWDQSRPERSYCICGPTIKRLRNDEVYEIKSSSGVQLVQEMRMKPLTAKLTMKAALTAAATDPAGCHRDAIRSLATIKLNHRLLISSSRDGAIKVWK